MFAFSDVIPGVKNWHQLRRDLAKKENKGISLLAAFTVLGIEITVMYLAGIFTLFNDHE